MKKVKALIIVAVMLVCANSAKAQSNDIKNLNYDRGYRFDIELACSIPTIWEFSSSEFLPDYKTAPTYYIPVFADVKYNFCNTLASPFISFKGGVDFDVCNTGMNININPAIGLDISRYSINFGYDMHHGVWRHSKGTESHYFKIGVGITI